MSLCALESKKYNKVIYNEKETLIYNGFKKAINGDFKNECRWISRETFNELKTTDPYVAICYSFGNNLKAYCYSEILEIWKEALHYARVFKDYSKFKEFGINSDGSKSDIIKNYEIYKKKYAEYVNTNNITTDALHLGELESMERLTRLESMERLTRLQSIESLNLSYESVDIPKDSVIYCDPPYINTHTYLSEFDHNKFYDWCRHQKSLIFVSEYNMPEDFYLIAEFRRKEIFNTNAKDVYEKLYCNKPFKPLYSKIKLF